STAELYQRIRDYLITMFFIMCGLIVLSIILAVKLQEFISRPILDLAEATARISAGDYSTRASRIGHDEIGTLYDAFNSMVGQIQTRQEERDKAELELRTHEAELQSYAKELERSNRELDQFAYVTSHDLKAPLQAISNLSE